MRIILGGMELTIQRSDDLETVDIVLNDQVENIGQVNMSYASFLEKVSEEPNGNDNSRDQ